MVEESKAGMQSSHVFWAWMKVRLAAKASRKNEGISFMERVWKSDKTGKTVPSKYT